MQNKEISIRLNKMQSAQPFSSPIYLTAKPIGAICNLDCAYCYYLKKKDLYPKSVRFTMSDTVLENFIRQYIQSQTMDQVLFLWHGGEPLLRGISFYEKALSLQANYKGTKIIDNCIQTNGTLLTDEWCDFFRKNNFLVGISIDGPKDFHDKYRKDKQGQSTFEAVLKGIDLLKKHQVDFNILAVVNNYNVDYPLEFYRFFKQIDCHYIQFSPVVEVENGKITSASVSATKWGNFLITLFKEWVKADVGTYFIQYFDATLANWIGVSPGICTLDKYCGHAGNIEFNGDVFSCDHFTDEDYKLGNIKENTLLEMMYSDKQKKFGKDKFLMLPQKCRVCKYLFACNGECPKNRIIETPEKDRYLNYLCEGFYAFFDYVAPYMDFMKRELMQQRSPANVMQYVQKWDI